MWTDSVPDLISIGMTEREAKLYLAMFEKPEWRAAELHRITGIPRAECHRTLELMLSRRYCTKRSEGRYNYYKPTSPKILNEILVNRWEEETAKRVNRTESIMTSLNEAFKANEKKNRSLDFIEIVQTPSRTHRRFTKFMNSAQSEVMSFNRGPYVFLRKRYSAKKYEEQKNANEEVLDKGYVRHRSITMYEEDSWHLFENLYDKAECTVLENIRISEFIPIKMFIIDRKSVLYTVNTVPVEEKDESTQIIVHDLPFATACCEYFEMHWEKSHPYKEWKKILEQKKKTALT